MHFVNWCSTYRLTLPQGIRYQSILLISTRSDPLTIDLFRKEGIQLLILPPHISHIMQPFDVGVGSPLKMHFRNQLIQKKEEYFRISNVSDASRIRSWYVKCFLSAIGKTFTFSTCRNAWRKSGLFPYDPHEPLSSEFVCSNIGKNIRQSNQNRLNISGQLLTSDQGYNMVRSFFAAKSHVPLNDFRTDFSNVYNHYHIWKTSSPAQVRILSSFPPYVFYTHVPVLDFI